MTAPQPNAVEVALRDPVPADRLDAVIRAAGPRKLAAIALLMSALGWHLARGCCPTVRRAVTAALPALVLRHAALHADAEGRG